MSIDLQHPDLSTPATAIAHLVAALRSGEFTQARGRLRQLEPNTGHCCLGVAGELCVRAGRARWDGDEQEWLVPASRQLCVDGSTSLLPDLLLDVFGFNHEDFAQQHLANANDRGASFAEIADALEVGDTLGLQARYPEPDRDSLVHAAELLADHSFVEELDEWDDDHDLDGYGDHNTDETNDAFEP